MNANTLYDPSESLLGCLPAHAKSLPNTLPAHARLTSGGDGKMQKLTDLRRAPGCQINEV